MRKAIVLVVCVLLGAQIAMAGGILTNSNHSAQYVRMLSRGATMDIDAVHYNPAGLVGLQNGLTLAFYSQTIGQTKTVKNDYPLLNRATYEGDVFVPVYPNFYAAYKMGKIAISFGFEPNAGGGSADFANGLPSFDQELSAIPLMLSANQLPTTAYDADISFNGSSIFYGFQLGATFELTDNLGVFVGGRYLMAQNTYEGSIKNIQINTTIPGVTTGSLVPASPLFTQLAQVFAADPVKNATFLALAGQMADKNVDVAQTGDGITPIIGVNYKFSDKLNVGLKYEGATEIVLENDTEKDDVGMFPDGAKSHSDLPTIYTMGIDYKPIPGLLLSGTGTYYFDKSANWDGREDYVKDSTWEVALGAQYFVTPVIAVSAGWNKTQVSVEDEFQSDIAHNLSSNSVGFGGCYLLSSNLAIDLGAVLTFYESDDDPGVDGNTGIPFMQTYERDSWDVAIGLSYRF